jgi:hypothetical protein
MLSLFGAISEKIIFKKGLFLNTNAKYFRLDKMRNNRNKGSIIYYMQRGKEETHSSSLSNKEVAKSTLWTSSLR